MSTSLQRLLPLYEREQARAEAMVLATVIRTAGPTYTKPGAQMLIARSGEYAGLLSGGCLEGDLSERAGRVFRSGGAELVHYDMRGPDDLLFGLGSGCEGAMDILLQRVDSGTAWQPLARLVAAWKARRPERLLLMVHAGPQPAAPVAGAGYPAGVGIFIDDGAPFGPGSDSWAQPLRQLGNSLQPHQGSRLLPQALAGADIFLLEQTAPPRLLLLGAGPDAQPVAALAVFLGWSPTIIDHRSHYARAERFPGAEAVIEGGSKALQALLTGAQQPYDAAIVMSHHLPTDLGYLRVLAGSTLPYIGLLGPASRRDRLLADLGAAAGAIAARLRAPVGLDLGATSPETIALSIVAEIQAALAGSASMAPMSARRAQTGLVATRA
jgi:xanthine/CO dehydrogenase XdhC/CoxF family maturation factor